MKPAILVLVMCSGAVAGCGSSASSTTVREPVAERVCTAARSAARPLLGNSVGVRIADSDAANVECLLSAGGVRLDLVAQASPRAWDQYDTAVVHQGQAYSGGVKSQSHLPRDLPGIGTNAAWVPAQSELFATNGTQSTGGSFLTVTVTRKGGNGPSSLSLAEAVASATLAVAPRGPNPGPAPS